MASGREIGWRRTTRPLAVSGPPRGIVAAGAIVGLAGTLGAGVLLVLAAAHSPTPLVPASATGWPHWLSGAFRGHGPALSAREWRHVLWLMFACYLLVVLCARAVPARVAFAAIAVATLLFLLGPPLLSTDVFTYVNWARIGVVHSGNPYVQSPSTFPLDVSYPWSNWHGLTTPYGPLFTLIGYALSAGGLPVAYWGFKILAAVACLASVCLIWRCASHRGDNPVPGMLMFGLCPVVLVDAVGGAHNDLVMIMLMLAGVWAALAGRDILAALAFVGSAGIKLPGAVPAVFWALRRGRLGRRLVRLAVAAGLVAALGLAAFGTHVFGIESAIYGPSVQRASLLSMVIGSRGNGHGIGTVIAVAAVPFTLGMLARNATSDEGDHWIEASGWVMIALICASSVAHDWYGAWPLAFAAVSHSRFLRVAAVGLAALLTLRVGIP